MITTVPLLSVVVPVYNGVRLLPASLAALVASDLPRKFWELVIVDDASTDGTAELAAEYADTIVRLAGRPQGPSYARNRGVEVARGEVVVFVDADVCVHTDTLRRFGWAFAAEPDVSAVFGSYDDRPAAPGIVSQYRNLLHHYVHHQSRGDAETFWAGCGAIRRRAFLDVGMYNEWHFSRPQIEDIELGHRLRDRGHRIVLRPEIQGTHLKHWTLRGVLTTDLKDRGVPWTRLLIQRGQARESTTLNLGLKERACTATMWFALLPPLAALALGDARWLWLSVVAVGAVLAANFPLYRFFRRARGLAFTIAILPLHLIYYLSNGASVLVAVVLHHTIGDPIPPASVQAFAERGVVKWPPVPRPVEALGTPPDGQNAVAAAEEEVR